MKESSCSCTSDMKQIVKSAYGRRWSSEHESCCDEPDLLSKPHQDLVRNLAPKKGMAVLDASREFALVPIQVHGDNLERALSGNAANGGLRQGVEVTYNALIQYLRQQGVERVEAEGQPFDPAWHEAVSTVPSAQYGVEPQTVVAVLEAAYRIGDRLLRPAKVIVAV